MTDNFEDQLRGALRPLEAPAGFASRVMGALPERRAAAAVTPSAATRPAVEPNYWRKLRAPVALAASLLVAVLLGQQMAVRQIQADEAVGRAASRELLQALHVTSQKLDLAYQAVKKPQDAVEENRS